MTWDRGRQQRPRVLVGEPFDGQRRQARKYPLIGRLPDREQQANRFSQQPPSDEPEHLGRGFIQPLGVIDQADQRPRGGILGQQAQHRQAHHEPVRSRPRRQPERHLQRALLRLRQRGQAAQHRRAELVQRRERQLHLGLHAVDLNQPAARGLARAVAHQRGLADPRLTPDDEHRTLTATNTVQQAVEDLAFASTPPEGRRPGCGHAVTIRPVIGAREHPGSKRRDCHPDSCHEYRAQRVACGSRGNRHRRVPRRRPGDDPPPGGPRLRGRRQLPPRPACGRVDRRSDPRRQRRRRGRPRRRRRRSGRAEALRRDDRSVRRHRRRRPRRRQPGSPRLQ